MKVVWTDEALDDLNEIVGYVTEHFPAVAPLLERRIRDTVARIRHWPQSARSTVGRSGVRVIPLGRYPYNLFYRVRENTVEILHIHHAACWPWEEQP